jgi:hypothetical protein
MAQASRPVLPFWHFCQRAEDLVPSSTQARRRQEACATPTTSAPHKNSSRLATTQSSSGTGFRPGRVKTPKASVVFVSIHPTAGTGSCLKLVPQRELHHPGLRQQTLIVAK